MPVSIGAAGADGSTPQFSAIPQVFIKKTWADDWKLEPRLNMTNLIDTVGDKEPGQCTLERQYGRVRHQIDERAAVGYGAIATVPPINLDNHWVKIEIASVNNNSRLQWVGRISPAMTILGGVSGTVPASAASSATPTGVQQWTAYGALDYLRRIEISGAYSSDRVVDPADPSGADLTNESYLDILPGINAGDEQLLTVGNRSATTTDLSVAADETYVYGGSAAWNYADYLDYVFNYWVNPRAADAGAAPNFKLSGQREILEAITNTVRLPDVINAADIVKKLINPKFGVSFKFTYREDDDFTGFELEVFALLGEPVAFAGNELPQNPNTIELDRTNDRTFDARIMTTADQRYSGIRLLGERIVVACTVYAKDNEGIPALIKAWTDDVIATGETTGTDEDELVTETFTEQSQPPGVALKFTDGNGHLVEVTNNAFTWQVDGEGPATATYTVGGLEYEYLQGSAATNRPAPEDHDEARARDILAAVFSNFAVRPDWDRQQGEAAPVLNNDGTLKSFANVAREAAVFEEFNGVPPFARFSNGPGLRQTLNWLPFRNGLDYTTDPPVDRNAAGIEPDLKSPAVYLLKPADNEGNPARYILADEDDFTIRVSKTDFGVAVQGKPNHRLALNHFDGAAPTDDEPEYDWEEIVFTFAFRSESRLKLEYRLPESDPDSGLTTKNIRVDDAEFWFAAPNTVVGIDANGQLQTISGSDGLVLRNDYTRLTQLMAGAISRYINERARAVITIKNLVPRSDLLGYILTVIQSGDAVQRVQAPITKVEYRRPAGGGPTQTIISTGFANKG